MYRSTLSLTSISEGVSGQRHALHKGKKPVTLNRRLGGPQGQSERVRIISLSPGSCPRTHISISYTHSAMGGGTIPQNQS